MRVAERASAWHCLLGQGKLGILVSSVLALCFCAFSYFPMTDYGIHGELFPVQEENFLSCLKRRVADLGEKDFVRLQTEIRHRLVSQLTEPVPVSNISPTQEYRSFDFDPTVRLNADIKDGEGKILFAKGTAVNPLTQVALEEDLLFFDGSQQEQIDWAKEQSGRWILVKGKPLELEEQEGRAVFFDQFGVLTKKLYIVHVPAKVSQKGLVLHVEEIPLQ